MRQFDAETRIRIPGIAAAFVHFKGQPVDRLLAVATDPDRAMAPIAEATPPARTRPDQARRRKR